MRNMRVGCRVIIILFIILLVVLISLGSAAVWYIWNVDSPYLKICKMNDGEVFRLSDLYDFEWDEVVIVNDPFDRPNEEIEELVDYYEERYNVDLHYNRSITLLVFYNDGVICDMGVYNYLNPENPMLGRKLREDFQSWHDYFVLERGSDVFEVLRIDNETYALLCDDQ